MTKKTVRTKKSYSKKFKKQAIDLLRTGKSLAEVSKEMNVPGTTVWGWQSLFPQKGELKVTSVRKKQEKVRTALPKPKDSSYLHAIKFIIKMFESGILTEANALASIRAQCRKGTK